MLFADHSLRAAEIGRFQGIILPSPWLTIIGHTEGAGPCAESRRMRTENKSFGLYIFVKILLLTFHDKMMLFLDTGGFDISNTLI